MAYRIPGNDDELDARLDDELARINEHPAPLAIDWRSERDRRRSPMRVVWPSTSIGLGVGMIFGHSLLEITLGIIGGAAAGFLISFLIRLVDKGERAAERRDLDDED